MLKSGLTPVLRAIHLLWARMGPARFYVLGALSMIVLLAAVGVFHLATARRPSGQSARREPVSNAPTEFSKPMPLPAIGDAISDDPLIAITEVAPKKRFGRHGEARVDVRVGVTPQAGARKGQVEIRLFFYDVNRDQEMRPTQAQVSYQWLTPVRDWTDPSPKYLVATYLRSAERRPPSDELKYGGFVVRVYLDGQLQDERSEPEGLIAEMRSQTRSISGSTPGASTAMTAAVSISSPTQATVTKTEATSNTIAPSAAVPVTSSETRTTADNAKLPYARPVPRKPGFVYSPFDEKFLIDVRGAPPGTVVNDPNAGKAFRVP
jgi:hypothetical protein